MSVSEHTYTATLLGTPDKPLRIRGGSVTLDEGAAPHVRATLTIRIPDQATLTALDQRQNKRVRIRATATGAYGPQERTFDLGLRDRVVNHAAGTVTLELASDEALLTDTKPGADDEAPFALAASLRAVVNYVLGKAIPGAVLAVSPAHDADRSPFWALSNLIHNPSVETVQAGWWAHSAQTSLTRDNSGGRVGTGRLIATATAAGTIGAHWTGAANTGGALFTQTIRAGTSYTGSAFVVGPTGKTARAILRFTNGVNFQDRLGPIVNLGAQDWSQRVSVTAEAPPGYSGVSLLIQGITFNANQALYIDAAMLTEGTRLVPFFDGATANDSSYIYTADGAPNASPSRRTPFPIERDPAALTWRAGQDALSFLHPLVQAAGFRLVCDENRVWTLRNETFTAPGAIAVRHGINLIDGTDSISRDAGLWFDAQVTRYTWTDRDGIQRERIDYYALTATPVLVNLVEVNTPYPGAGRSEYAVRRAQGRGREVTATAVADWTARAEQAVTVVLDASPTQLGATSRVTFDLDQDRMELLTRTTDVGAGSINLLQGTINALPGTINTL